MSWNPALIPHCPDADLTDAIDTLVIPRSRDVGGFAVRRALPAPKRQMVGPFIFFDQMGPADLITGEGVDVRPHPHIGLATVTYLFEGEFQHRDSLGSNQIIRPGAVNWMIAGRGVTHSERTSGATRRGEHRLFGIQTWVALPEAEEESEARFEHYDAAALPVLDAEGVELRLAIGRGWGAEAPVKTFTDMFYAHATLEPGAKLALPDDHEDRGIYVVTGTISVASQQFDNGRMIIFRPGDGISVTAGDRGARIMLLGGETLDGPRYIWWNFVASSKERIEEARRAWREREAGDTRFSLPPGDEEEFIPLPEH